LALTKQEFKDDEIAIFDEACVYKRGEYWQFRMWLAKGNKYAQKKPTHSQLTEQVGFNPIVTYLGSWVIDNCRLNQASQ